MKVRDVVKDLLMCNQDDDVVIIVKQGGFESAAAPAENVGFTVHEGKDSVGIVGYDD